MHKLQNGSQVTIRPARKPQVGTGGYFAESNDSGGPSIPGQDWFNDCTDEFLNALAAAGIEYDPLRLDHLARLISGSNFAWLSMPIGSPFPLIGDLPPTDSDAFRYVVLTDADPYNDGALVNKEVSGTAPNLVIKYTIDMPDSPLNGTKIEMLNTMKAVLSASVANGEVFMDAARNFGFSISALSNNSAAGYFSSATQGLVLSAPKGVPSPTAAGDTGRFGTVSFDLSKFVPVGNRHQTFAIGANYLMRIK